MLKLDSTRLGLFAVSATFLASIASAHAVELRILNSWNEKAPLTKLVSNGFVEKLKNASNGRIKIVVSGPEVIAPFEQLQPVSSGSFDFLFTHAAYHFGSKGLGVTLDSLKSNPELRRKSGIWDIVDKYYQKQNNVKLIGVFPFGQYHFILKKGLSAKGDWAGRKIRGTKPYHSAIKSLGGSPVVLKGGEIYSALEKGVIDGAAWPNSGALNFKWYEVAKVRVRPSFGSSSLLILMNLDKFKSLNKADRDIILEVGRKHELAVDRESAQISKDEDVQLDKLGMTIEKLSPANYKKVSSSFNDTLWIFGKVCCGEISEKIRKIALESGLLK